MKYVVHWKIKPECYKEAVRRFLETGAPAPEGLKDLGRWHTPGSATGWHVLEGDPGALAQLAATWGDLLELDTTPVLDDSEAATALEKVHGK
jgi:hypothetical protein